MINDAAVFSEDLYDMSPEEIIEFTSNNSRNDYVYIEFSYKQLGRDEKWFNTQCRQLNNNALKIKREVLLSWTRTSDASVFSEEQMDTITKFANLHTIVPSGYKHYKLNIYSERFNINNFMIAGVDVAGGLGKNRDSSAVVFVDPGTSEVLASIHSNKIDTDELYLLLIYLFGLCPNTIFAIERNSYGLPIIQRLVKNDDYRKRLFFRAANGSDREKINGDISKSQLSFSGTEDRVYGVDTNTFSRDAMMNILAHALDETPELFRADEMNKQIQTLQYAKGGKIEHAPGCHDDLIMAYLVACYAMTLTVDFSNSVSDGDMQRTKIGSNLQNRSMTSDDTKSYNNILDMDQELTKYQSSQVYRESRGNNDLSARRQNPDDLANDLFFLNSMGDSHGGMQDGFDAINSLNDSDW